jgi:DNA-binding CsgD family transcriptional regulator
VKLKQYYPAIILASATLFFAYDIVADFLEDGESMLHVVIESLVFIAILIVLLVELRRVSHLQVEVRLERDKTARLSGELLSVMRGQFSDWGLSPSEYEVALLLIKGLSMKEISLARGVKEKTVRQQATGIYAKSGYAGRHELVAHFIEDLMSYDVGAGP